MAVFIGNSVTQLSLNQPNAGKHMLLLKHQTDFPVTTASLLGMLLQKIYKKTPAHIVHSLNPQQAVGFPGFLGKDVNSCRHRSVRFDNMISLILQLSVVCC